MNKDKFRIELIGVINRNCMENGSNTPDFILAEYLISCLDSYDKITYLRERWYGRVSEPIGNPPK